MDKIEQNKCMVQSATFSTKTTKNSLCRSIGSFFIGNIQLAPRGGEKRK